MRILLAAFAVFMVTSDWGVVVIDGDTLDIDGERIRLHGIDAPEDGQDNCEYRGHSCGEVATAALAYLIGDSEVECDPVDTDRYGRTVAVCYADGVDLGRVMVREGMARAYRRYSSAYISDEADAKRHHRGFWETGFPAPWNWRRRNR